MKQIFFRCAGLLAFILYTCSVQMLAQNIDVQTFTTEAWMQHIADSTAMCKLSIPGTHDSGATLGGEALQTQGCSITAQLRKGIRAFDIRLKKRGHMLGVFHSDAFQEIYWEKDVLPTFIHFLNEHPSETLIVSLKREGGRQEDYAMLLSSSINDIHNNPYFVTNFHPGLTLSECRGKILFLHRDEVMKNYPGAACQNWADDATCMLTLRNKDGKGGYALLQDEYQYKSTQGAGKKLEVCINNLKKKTTGPYNSQLWGISFASATGLPEGTPQAFANQINAPLANYIAQSEMKHCGIVFIDFIEQEGGQKLVMELIRSNISNR